MREPALEDGVAGERQPVAASRTSAMSRVAVTRATSIDGCGVSCGACGSSSARRSNPSPHSSGASECPTGGPESRRSAARAGSGCSGPERLGSTAAGGVRLARRAQPRTSVHRVGTLKGRRDRGRSVDPDPMNTPKGVGKKGLQDPLLLNFNSRRRIREFAQPEFLDPPTNRAYTSLAYRPSSGGPAQAPE